MLKKAKRGRGLRVAKLVHIIYKAQNFGCSFSCRPQARRGAADVKGARLPAAREIKGNDAEGCEGQMWLFLLTKLRSSRLLVSFEK
jgi:hypothetical protein